MILALQISDQLHLALSAQFQSEFIFSRLTKTLLFLVSRLLGQQHSGF